MYFTQLIITVNFEKVVTLADEAIYNYFYLNKFFFGRKSYINKYNYVFSMNKYFYSFVIAFKTKKQSMFFPLSFLLNDVLI